MVITGEGYIAVFSDKYGVSVNGVRNIEDDF
jgi:hypothetical protein